MTGVDDEVHAIDEVLRAYDRAWEPKRLELLEFGLSIEPGLGGHDSDVPSLGLLTLVALVAIVARIRGRTT